MSRREQLEKLLQADPGDTFLQYALAMDFISAGQTEDGLERLRAVIRRDPAYVPAYFQQGQVLARLGRLEQAREVLTLGIAAAQQASDTHAEREMREFLESL